MTSDQKFMQIAIRLAGKGAGWVNPNPMVGAVLVNRERIIGSGFHAYFGGPHAEVNAFLSVLPSDRPLIEGSTLYVTLEPCDHYGKTPPCTNLILENKIGRVVIGMADPNPAVNGKGISKLKQNGIEVLTDCLGPQVAIQNQIFIKYITTGKPFVLLKSAMTLDGKIATVTNASQWITGSESRKLVHRIRQQYGAIMVGIDTVVADDPLLNVRLKEPSVKDRAGIPDGPVWKNPLKVIADTRGRIPLTAKVLTNDPQLTIVAVTHLAQPSKLKAIERLGAQVLICPEKDHRVDLEFILSALGTMGVDSVMIEGGSTLAFSAMRDGLVDKVISFIAPKILGGEKAPTPVGGDGIEKMEDAIALNNLKTRKIGEDIMVEGYPVKKHSDQTKMTD